MATQGPAPRSLAAMLGGNAAELYDLDLEKLNAIAERIGPERSLFRDEA